MTLKLHCLILLCVTLAPLAAETVTFQPGCLAKVYALGSLPAGKPPTWNTVTDDPKIWPIKALPDAPSEILRLKALPEVDVTPLEDVIFKNISPSMLVTAPSLTGINYYAVEFEGYFLATREGVYGFAATSDDPVKIIVEGQLIGESTYSADPTDGPREFGDEGTYGGTWWRESSMRQDPPVQAFRQGSAGAAQGAVSCAPNRWYAVQMVAFQRALPASKSLNFRVTTRGYYTTDINRGAIFHATMTTPDNKSGPIPLHLPVVK